MLFIRGVYPQLKKENKDNKHIQHTQELIEKN